jgi:hypothetical protein
MSGVLSNILDTLKNRYNLRVKKYIVNFDNNDFIYEIPTKKPKAVTTSG